MIPEQQTDMRALDEDRHLELKVARVVDACEGGLEVLGGLLGLAPGGVDQAAPQTEARDRDSTSPPGPAGSAAKATAG